MTSQEDLCQDEDIGQQTTEIQETSALVVEIPIGNYL